MAFISSNNLGDRCSTVSNNHNTTASVRATRMASLGTNVSTIAKRLPRQWMLRCRKRKRSLIQRIPLANSTSPARIRTVNLHTNLLQLLQAQPSISGTLVPLAQLARTENVRGGIHLLRRSMTSKPNKTASFTLIAPILAALSSTPACRRAVMEQIVQHRTASSHTARLCASSTHV